LKNSAELFSRLFNPEKQSALLFFAGDSSGFQQKLQIFVDFVQV
jgi:hypothetical protein